jgi:hypothetical protein
MMPIQNAAKAELETVWRQWLVKFMVVEKASGAQFEISIDGQCQTPGGMSPL